MHHLYIWDCTTGQLAKVLEGPKSGLVDISVCSDNAKSRAKDTPLTQMQSLNHDTVASYAARDCVDINIRRSVSVGLQL